MNKLLLLHGALGAKEQFEPLQESLKNEFETYSLDFSGHGKSGKLTHEFSIPIFAEDVLDRMKLKSEILNIFSSK